MKLPIEFADQNSIILSNSSVEAIQWKMKKIYNCYSKKSTSKQICIGVSLVMVLTVVLISGVLFIQFLNIKEEQAIHPKKFFTVYDKYSLLTIAKTNKDLILDILDMRRNFINLIRDSLIRNRFRIRQSRKRSPKIIPPNETIQCIFSDRTKTIFSCRMDIQTDFLLKGLNVFQFNRPIKRYNIYYQNKANKSDIMLKSLSRNKITSINITDINERIESISQGTFTFSNFYKDYYQNNANESVGYRGKVTFDNYTILLQQEGFGSFVKRSITRNIYAEDVNAMVLLPDKSDPRGYKIVSNFKDLDPQLNYTALLSPGYHETVLKNGEIISSYTQSFPSQFKVDKMIEKKQIYGQTSHVLIIHSPCINKDMEYNILNFIQQLLEKLIIFLVFGLVILVLAALTITFHVTQIIKQSLRTIKINIFKYSNKLESPGDIIRSLIEFKSNLEFFKSIPKNLYEIIKGIEEKKRKNSKIGKKQHKYDEIPLNLIDINFQKRHLLEDVASFEALRIELFGKRKKSVKNF